MPKEFDPTQFTDTQAEQAREERERLLQLVYEYQTRANGLGEMLHLWEQHKENHGTKTHSKKTHKGLAYA